MGPTHNIKIQAIKSRDSLQKGFQVWRVWEAEEAMSKLKGEPKCTLEEARRRGNQMSMGGPKGELRADFSYTCPSRAEQDGTPGTYQAQRNPRSKVREEPKRSQETGPQSDSQGQFQEELERMGGAGVGASEAGVHPLSVCPSDTRRAKEVWEPLQGSCRGTRVQTAVGWGCFLRKRPTATGPRAW